MLAAWESENPDNEVPVVAIVSPADGTVSGVVRIDVNASDDVGVTHVELYVDGQIIGRETSAPFVFNWDSTTVPDGERTLLAYAYDAAGNEGISSPVTFNVQNEQNPEICGDLDEDQDVDYSDYMIFRATFGLRAGDPGYVEKADSDGDKWITMVDFAAWYGCYRDYLAGR